MIDDFQLLNGWPSSLCVVRSYAMYFHPAVKTYARSPAVPVYPFFWGRVPY